MANKVKGNWSNNVNPFLVKGARKQFNMQDLWRKELLDDKQKCVNPRTSEHSPAVNRFTDGRSDQICLTLGLNLGALKSLWWKILILLKNQ